MPETLSAEVVWLALAATDLPADFFSHVISNPGENGEFALAALARPDVPAHLVEPLFHAALTTIPDGWNSRGEAVGCVAVLRVNNGVPARDVAQSLEADLAAHCAPHHARFGVCGVLDAFPADHPMVRELLQTHDTKILDVVATSGDTEHAVAALLRLDELVAAAPGDRELLAAAREAGAGIARRLAQSGSIETDSQLNRVRSGELLAWWLSGGKVKRKVRPTLSNLVVDRVVLACLNGELRGSANLVRVAAVVEVFGHTWTPEGARKLAAGANASTLPSARGQALRDAVAASAASRLRHYDRVEHLDGLDVPQDASLASLRGCASRPMVANWLVAQLGNEPGVWDRVAQLTELLQADTPVDEVGAVLRAVTA